MKIRRTKTVEVDEEMPDEACEMRYAIVWPYDPTTNAPAGCAAMFRTKHDAESFMRPIIENYKGKDVPFQIVEIIK